MLGQHQRQCQTRGTGTDDAHLRSHGQNVA
jgi:hypothetical protein